MTMRFLTVVAVLSLAAAPVLAQDRCANCGTVESIRESTVKTGWTPLGASGTAGMRETAGDAGRVSTQYNFTSGNMVLLGAAGGAGYAKRPNSYERPRWDVTVRMDDGTRRTVGNDYEPTLREGDRVRIYGTQLELM